MDKIQADFEAFHEKNPKVFKLFSRFANEAFAVRSVGSARLILELIRWEIYVKTTGNERDLKINNNYTPLYARLWESEDPSRIGFFKKRKRRAHTKNSTEAADPVHAEA